MTPADPPKDCDRCPRLFRYRSDWAAREPDWFNAPVPTWRGSGAIKMLVVGMAPGLRGANRTGRPFTGDFAGVLLYETLCTFGFARGTYNGEESDGLVLRGTAITNAVRCVPPANKPTAGESANCRPFLEKTIAALPRLRVILALGRLAHDNVLTALAQTRSHFPFAHHARHRIAGLVLYDSYHCSRYNTNTKRLTPEMFGAVVGDIRREIDKDA